MAEPVGETVPVTEVKEPEQEAPAAVVEEIVEKAEGLGSSPPPVSRPDASGDVTAKPRGFSFNFGGIHKSKDKKSVHKFLGGGRAADVMLWKDKKLSAAVIGGATLIWVLFDMLDYHLLTLISHVLLVSLIILFLWSKASILINKEPPKIPEVQIPEKLALEVATALHNDINRAFRELREIALGHDLIKLGGVIFGLWILGETGEWFDLLSLLYIVVLVLHTLPFLYDKYQDEVDHYVDIAMVELKKQYSVLDEKFFSKIPKGPTKSKKQL